MRGNLYPGSQDEQHHSAQPPNQQQEYGQHQYGSAPQTITPVYDFSLPQPPLQPPHQPPQQRTPSIERQQSEDTWGLAPPPTNTPSLDHYQRRQHQRQPVQQQQLPTVPQPQMYSPSPLRSQPRLHEQEQEQEEQYQYHQQQLQLQQRQQQQQFGSQFELQVSPRSLPWLPFLATFLFSSHFPLFTGYSSHKNKNE
jgi:hypothetical protein